MAAHSLTTHLEPVWTIIFSLTDGKHITSTIKIARDMLTLFNLACNTGPWCEYWLNMVSLFTQAIRETFPTQPDHESRSTAIIYSSFQS